MILNSFKLDDKVVLITGAGRGLGRAMAVRFANCGADIVAAARTVSQLEETAALVEAFLAKNTFTEKQIGQAMGMFMKEQGTNVDPGVVNPLIKRGLAGK